MTFGLVLIGLPLAVAAALLWRTDTRAGGVVALAVFVTLLPAALMSFGFASSKTDGDSYSLRLRVRVYAISTLIGAFVAVGCLGFLAEGEREGGMAVVYGEQVRVRLPDSCISSKDDVSCYGATWQIGDVRYTGAVHLAHGELDTHMAIGTEGHGVRFTNNSIEAYVYPGFHDAYTAKHHSSDIDGMEAFAFLPRWMTWLIPGAIGAFFAFGIVGVIWEAIKKRRTAARVS